MWEILTGEEPYADMHCGAIIGKVLIYVMCSSDCALKTHIHGELIGMF